MSDEVFSFSEFIEKKPEPEPVAVAVARARAERAAMTVREGIPTCVPHTCLYQTQRDGCLYTTQIPNTQAMWD